MSALAVVARGYARRGWAVFPLAGKQPRTKHGLLDASRDAEQVARWWDATPDASIGVRTGAAPGGSGVWVLDLDAGTDAEERVEAEADGRPWRETLTARTGGGGKHLVYLYDADIAAWLAAERLTLPTRNGIGGKGLDVRSDGGYIVAVPSLHDSGRQYEWANRCDIVAAPEWLIRMVSKPVEVARVAPPPPRVEGNGYGAAVLRNACAKVAATSEGGRHDELLRQARTVGGYLASAGIGYAEAEAALCAAGVSTGKDANEVRRTVRDGLAYGQLQPLAVPDRPEPAHRAPGGSAGQATGPADHDEGREDEPPPGDRMGQARSLMARSLAVLYAEQTTRAERQEIARELAGSVDLLAEVASGAGAEWASWCAGVEAAGGMGEHLRGLRRAVKAGQDQAREVARQAKQAKSGDSVERARIMARLSVTAEGTVKGTYANIVTILRGDPRYSTLRCSSLGGVVELVGDEVEEGPGTADLCEWLRDSYGMDASDVTAKTALYDVAKGRTYSPVRDYLDRVRGKGTGDTVGALLRECLGIADPSAMQAAMLGRFLISAVARAMQPGCKVDTALVLVGEQGAKKSSFFAGLFGSFFGDSPIPIGNKDAPIMMSRVWGYEAAELEDLTSKRSAESVKQFLGSSKDLYRPPFARTAILNPRHTVLCGSINPAGGKGGSAAFLSDPSGSRRFWILTVPPRWVVPLARLRELRDAAWADALAEYESGERWWFDRAEDEEREEDAQQYQIEDVWHASVAGWLQGGPALVGNFTTADALAGIGIETGQRTQATSVRVRAILVRLGWVERSSPAGFRGLRVWQRG